MAQPPTQEIGATIEEWYPAEAVYSFDAPGVWEGTERASAAPRSLQAVWSEDAPRLAPGGGSSSSSSPASGTVSLPLAAAAATPSAAQPHAAATASAASAATPAPAPAPASQPAAAAAPGAAAAPPRAAWGKLSAELRASAATVPDLFGGSGQGGGGGNNSSSSSSSGGGGVSEDGAGFAGSGGLSGLDLSTLNALAALSNAAAAGGGGGGGGRGEAHPMRPSAAATAAALSSMLTAAAAAQGFVAPPQPPPQRPQDRPGNTLCTFFLTGLCRFGDLCKFRHAKPEPWAVEYFENLLLERLERVAGGEGGEGEEGEGSGGEGGSGSGGGGGGSASAAAAAAAAASQSDQEFAAASRAWLGASLEAQTAILHEAVAAGVCSDLDAAEIALGAAERGVSRSIECSVCLENVTDAVGRRFGLLTGCEHAFCLDCIREWRARADLPAATVRACPLCRRVSFYVIPSDRYVSDAGRKARLNEEYHAAQRALPCRMYDQGRGVCPFGTSCFYAHLLPDGTPAPVARHTFRVNTDGEIKGVGKKPTLADFLFTK